MNNHKHDVISVFLDNEPFDAPALVEALADPEGRALLVDLVALRHVVQPADALVVLAPPRRAPGPVLWVAAAASICLAAFGGYQFGVRRDAGSDPPPPATVVIKASNWTDVAPGGGR
jgi:hypothetical protein